MKNIKMKISGNNIKTCMLVWENCLPFCPFKREHDDLQVYFKDVVYWDSYLGSSTCRRWKENVGQYAIPRIGTNCFWISVDTFKEYAELVDIFKHSGRLVDCINNSRQRRSSIWMAIKKFP